MFFQLQFGFGGGRSNPSSHALPGCGFFVSSKTRPSSLHFAVSNPNIFRLSDVPETVCQIVRPPCSTCEAPMSSSLLGMIVCEIASQRFQQTTAPRS